MSTDWLSDKVEKIEPKKALKTSTETHYKIPMTQALMDDVVALIETLEKKGIKTSRRQVFKVALEMGFDSYKKNINI